MFLNKIKSRTPGILTYGITPPKSGTAPERIAQIAARTMARLHALDIDALIVYDVQDESSRTSVERPFPFLQAQDPFEYAAGYLHELKVPKVIYRPAGKFSKTELSLWLDDLKKNNFYPVFVGLPAPNHPVKTTLKEAYEIWSAYEDTSVLGAITIPERHEVTKDEDRRILDKAGCGVSYFISQCVFNVAYAKQVVEDLHNTCAKERTDFPTVIFTLTVCGSEKTLHFMEWLGIHVPDELKQDFRNAANMLEKSIQVCLDIAAELTAFCADKAIPFGFNIESVATRADEIEASVYMVNRIAEMLDQYGIRKMLRDTEKDFDNREVIALSSSREESKFHQRKTGTA